VDGGKPLEATLVQASATLPELRGALESLDAPLAHLEGAMSTLRPGARALGETVPDLRGTLREAVPVLEKVPGVADSAEPAMEDLEVTFADARPLAPLASDALVDLEQPLSVLAPYAPEIGQFFVRGHSFVSEGPAPGTRYARLSANVAVHAATGGVYEAKDYPRTEYPAPGQATNDRADNLIPPGVVPSGGGR
jgi:phospholipid/cholesterol/gamma-HCH transport system substrate-binding protein